MDYLVASGDDCTLFVHYIIRPKSTAILISIIYGFVNGEVADNGPREVWKWILLIEGVQVQSIN